MPRPSDDQATLGPRLLRRSRRALLTPPTPRDLLEATAIALSLAAVAVPMGIATGLFEPGLSRAPAHRLLAFAAAALVLPAFLEELVFRVWVLPARGESAPRHIVVRDAGIALAAFVAWHPLNAWLWLPDARDTFYDLRFLLLAACLGLACTVAYLRSGSIWPAMAIHWVAVLAWKLLLGGDLVIVGG